LYGVSQNQPPVLDPIGPKETREFDTLNFTVTASDPDLTIPSLYTSTPLPDGAVFLDNANGTGTFDWVPAIGQAGDYSVIFYASDGSLVDSEVVMIQVQVATCCTPPSVGDLDQGGGDLGFNYDGANLSLMINGLFIDPANGWDGICLDEADIDFSSVRPVIDPFKVDGADLSVLIDALFISPTTHYLNKCDGSTNP